MVNPTGKGRKTAKLDETGLEIAGCRHGLAQWAINMYQGELYGYANYIHVKKMIPAGVTYFWEDIVCKYWKWAKKAGGVEGSGMKPALSVMYAKAHNWTCQVHCRFIARLQFCLLVSIDVSYQYRR